MTVKELRDALAALPDDLRVLVRGYEGGLEDLTSENIEPVNVTLDVHEADNSVYGPHERQIDSTTPALLLDRCETEYSGDHHLPDVASVSNVDDGRP